MTFCPISIIPRMNLPQITLMIILAIAINMVYHKRIVKFSDKGLIDKSMNPVFPCFTITT